MAIAQRARISELFLSFRAWVAGAGACVLAGLAVLQRFSERGLRYRVDPLLIVELVLLTLCLAEVWWVLRRGRGSPTAIALPILAAVASVLTVWVNGPANIIYIVATMMLLFAFLPMRAATYLSLAVMVASFVVLARVWDADAATLIRIPLATGSVLALLMMTRRMIEALVGSHAETIQLLSDTLEATDQGIGVLGRDGVIKAFNRRAAEMLDVPAELLDGREVTVDMAVALQRHRGELSVIAASSPDAEKAVRLGLDVFHPEFPERFVRRTLTGRWLQVTTRRMPSGDIVRSYSDVTAYQEALQTAASAARVRTAFLSNVSHELRTPLNALLGLSRLVRQSQLSTRQRQWIEGIEESGEQLLRLVQDVLDLTALESGASQVTHIPFALPEVLDPLQRSVAARCAARDMAFTMDVDAGVPTDLHGDPERLLRVLEHLVMAAAEAMTDGRLVLRVRAADDRRVRFEVRRATLVGRLEGSTRDRTPADDAAVRAAVPEASFARRLVEVLGGEWEHAADGDVSEVTSVSFSLDATRRGVPAPEASPGAEPSAHAPMTASPTATLGGAARVKASTEANAPRSLPLGPQRRIEGVLAAVRGRRATLATLPYRGWILGNGIVSVGLLVMGFVSLTLLRTANATEVLRRVVIPAFALGVLQLVSLWRHRRFDRPDAWDRTALLGAALMVFVFASWLNGAPPAVLLSAGILYLYVSVPLPTARWGSLVLSLAVFVSAWRFPDDVLIFTRALIGGLLTWGLTEVLVRALRESTATFEETAMTLQEASAELLLEQEALTRSQGEAAAALERREELMAVVSHEIRTPLNAILGLAQLTLRTDLTSQQRAWMIRMREYGTYLTALIHDILDLTRIQAGKLRLSSVPFELDEVLRPVEDVLKGDAAAKGLRTTLDVAPDVPRWLRGDPLHLTQILLNLVGNAVRYTSYGSVAVRVRLESSGGTRWIRMEVQDTGDGLSAAQQARLFRPFEQVGDGAMRAGGTGLGLSITKWLVEQMGGTIGVRSEPGVGSTFWFTVQMSEAGVSDPTGGSATPVVADRHQARALRRSLRRIAGARVLVVDDTRINREIAAELMRGVGLEVVEVADGMAAVARVRAEPFDVVLLDLQMPEMDGFVVAQEIRRQHSAEALPIVAMTASSLLADHARCLAAGMNGSLEKPFDPEDLWAILLRWIPDRPDATPTQEESPTGPIHAPVIPSALASIRGLSVEQGLRRVLGNEPLYRALLAEFVRGQARTIERLQSAVQAEQVDVVAQLAHVLAGVAGGIGAAEVHQAAAALERDVRQGQVRRELLVGVAVVRRALAPLLADLEAMEVDAQGPNAQGDSVSVVDAEALLAGFAALLDAHDPEAREWVTRHGGVLDRFGADAAVIRSAVRQFDLAGAAAALRRAREG